MEVGTIPISASPLRAGTRYFVFLSPFLSMKPMRTSFSMMLALVAGIPRPLRSASSGISLHCLHSPLRKVKYLLKAFVKGVRGYFSYYLRRFSLCFCLNNAFQPVLSSQTATMVKKHFDFIICFALLNHKNSIRFVFLQMVIWGG